MPWQDGPFAEVTRVGSGLFMRGGDPLAGRELLALGPEPGPPCVADDKTLCLLGDRFAVQVRWLDYRSRSHGIRGRGDTMAF